MGMSSTEWATYLRDELGVRLDPDAISDEVVRLVQEQYADRLPLLPGAVETVRNIATHWPLGLASSSNRPIIDLVLDSSALGPLFAVTVSSEEVARGQAGAGRLPRSGPTSGRRPRGVRRHRGLDERHPCRPRRGNGRDRRAQHALPAGRCRARASIRRCGRPWRRDCGSHSHRRRRVRATRRPSGSPRWESTGRPKARWTVARGTLKPR